MYIALLCALFISTSILGWINVSFVVVNVNEQQGEPRQRRKKEFWWKTRKGEWEKRNSRRKKLFHIRVYVCVLTPPAFTSKKKCFFYLFLCTTVQQKKSNKTFFLFIHMSSTVVAISLTILMLMVRFVFVLLSFVASKHTHTLLKFEFDIIFICIKYLVMHTTDIFFLLSVCLHSHGNYGNIFILHFVWTIIGFVSVLWQLHKCTHTHIIHMYVVFIFIGNVSKIKSKQSWQNTKWTEAKAWTTIESFNMMDWVVWYECVYVALRHTYEYCVCVCVRMWTISGFWWYLQRGRTV